MGDVTGLRTCGRCAHFMRDPGDLTRGMCRALPPTPTYIHGAGPGGGPAAQLTGVCFPVVPAKMDACGVHFKQRPLTLENGQ